MESCMCVQPACSTVSERPNRIDGERIKLVPNQKNSERSSCRHDKTRNPKLEIRNNVKCPKFKTQNAPVYELCILGDLEIRILNLFRISKFELRISKGKF